MAIAKKTVSPVGQMPGMPDAHKYEVEHAARTLQEAEEIKKNRPLMKEVKSHAKNLTKAVNKK